MDIDGFLSLLNRGGVVALLAFNLWAFVRGWIVPQWVHDDLKAAMTAEREEKSKWRSTAMQATENADRSLLMLEQLRSERSSRN